MTDTLTCPPSGVQVLPPAQVDVSDSAPEDALVGLSHLATMLRAVEGSQQALTAVAAEVRRLVNAERASILLVEDGRWLSPATSIARQADGEVWVRFVSMAPIDLDAGIPTAREALASGEVLVIADAARSPFVPAAWRDAFRLGSLLVAPMVADGEPIGALVVDRPPSSRAFRSADCHVLRVAAGLGAAAVMKARADASALRVTQRWHTTVRTFQALPTVADVRVVADVAVGALSSSLSASSCGLSFVDDLQVHSAAGNGPAAAASPWRLEQEPALAHWLSSGGEGPTVLSDDVVAGLSGPYADLRGAPACVGVRFFDGGRLAGFALAALPERGIAQERLQEAAIVADVAWLALTRARVRADLSIRLRFVEVLRHLADDLTLFPEMALIVQRLAPLAHHAGVELVEGHLLDRAAARRLAATALPAGFAAAVRRWRKNGMLEVTGVGEQLAIPLALDGDVVGLIRARPIESAPLSPSNQELLTTAGVEVGGLIARAYQRGQLAEGERQLAVADERDRVARQLHQSLGAMLGRSATLLARPPADSDARAQLRAVIGQAQAALADGTGTLVACQPQSLRARLRLLATSVPLADEAMVAVTVSGRARPLAPSAEAALFRFTAVALTVLQRHSRSTDVFVRLQYSDDEVQLSVRDNGRELATRPVDGASLHATLRGLQRMLEDVGGRLTPRSMHNGLVLVATIGT